MNNAQNRKTSKRSDESIFFYREFISFVRCQPIPLILIISLFLIDRLLKNYFYYKPEAVEIIPGLLRVETVWNSGIAFSLPLTGSLAIWIILFLISGLIIALLHSILRGSHPRSVGYLMILMGALSNFFDRINWGGILDYVRLWQYSIFNIADVMIVIGVVVLILLPMRDETVYKKL